MIKPWKKIKKIVRLPPLCQKPPLIAAFSFIIRYYFRSVAKNFNEANTGIDALVDENFWQDSISIVKETKEDYPQSLLDLLERNPETEDFVLDYPINKDREFEVDLSCELTKGTIPLFLQWDVRWGFYNNGTFHSLIGYG